MKSFFFLVFLFVCTILNLFSQTWEYINPYPQGNALYDISFSDELHGMAVGEKGTIITTNDSGLTWEKRFLNSTLTLRSCQMIDKDIAWTSGDSSSLLRTTDGGISWDRIDPVKNQTAELLNFRFINKDTGFVWSYKTLLKTTDRGNSWQIINDFDTFTVLNFINDSLIYGITQENRNLLKSVDGGISWIEIKLKYNGSLKDVYFINDSLGWILSISGQYNVYLQMTKDGGKTWEITYLYWYYADECKLYFVDENLGYSFYRNDILITKDGGKNWNYVNINLNVYPKNFSYRNTSCFWGVGSYGTIIKSSPDKSQWRKLGGNFIADGSQLYSAYFSDKVNGYALGNNSAYLSSNGGKTWDQIKQLQTSSAFTGVFFLDKNYGWIWGTNGSLFRTTNGGSDWAEIKFQTSQKINQVWFFDKDEGFLVGDGFPIIATVDGGKTWYEPGGGLLYWLRSIYFVNRNIGWAVGSAIIPQILKTTDGGTNWIEKTIDVDVLLSKVWFFDEDYGLTAGEGKLYKSSDGGESWVNIFNKMVTIKDFHFFDKNNGWLLCSKDSYSIFYWTNDGGETWNQYQDVFNPSLSGMFFLDKNTGWAVGDNCSVLKFTDNKTDVPDVTPQPDDIKISPNPASDYIYISTGSVILSEAKNPVQIYNTLGECVKRVEQMSTSVQRIDISGLTPGIYFVRVGYQIQKFVKM